MVQSLCALAKARAETVPFLMQSRKLLGSDVGVPCRRAVQQGLSPSPFSNSDLRWGREQFHLCKRCCVMTSLRERALSSHQ